MRHTFGLAVRSARKPFSVRMLSLLLSVGVATAAHASGRAYYVDCQSGSDSASATAPQTAWKSLGKVNATTFSPSDQILFHRGSTCAGQLWPKGSGSASLPIRLAAYGSGALPIIDGAGKQEAFRLFNQQYWQISSLDVQNSTVYGIHISGDTGVLHHIYLSNLRAHHIHGDLQDKDSGAIVVSTGGPNQTFDDVLIDGVDAYDVTQWSGILVNALNSGFSTTAPRNHNVRIRNSVAHDVYGDGIIIFGAVDALIEHSLDYRTGLQPTETIGTPNGIWTFDCQRCVVQFNEGFKTTSPGVDGGVYDIDYQSIDSTVQYNYAHDADGYCVGLFAAGVPQLRSTVRYNVCINNGRKKEIAFQGDLYLVAFNGGTFDGVDIHNNTSVWSPVEANPALVDFGAYDSPAFFRNNLIRANESQLINASSSVKLDHNLYWVTGSSAPSWTYNNVTYPTFAKYKAGSKQDGKGLFADPIFLEQTPTSPLGILLDPSSPALNAGVFFPTIGTRDFFGLPVPQGGSPAPSIGAYQGFGQAFSSSSARAGSGVTPACSGKVSVVAVVNSVDPTTSDAAHNQVVAMRGLAEQYPATELCVSVIDRGIAGDIAGQIYASNLQQDWNFGAVQLRSGALGGAPAAGVPVELYLFDTNGAVEERWGDGAPPVFLGPAVRAALAAR